MQEQSRRGRRRNFGEIIMIIANTKGIKNLIKQRDKLTKRIKNMEQKIRKATKKAELEANIVIGKTVLKMIENNEEFTSKNIIPKISSQTNDSDKKKVKLHALFKHKKKEWDKKVFKKFDKHFPEVTKKIGKSKR